MRIRYHRALRLLSIDLTDAPAEHTEIVDSQVLLRMARDGEVLGIDVLVVDPPAAGIEIVERGFGP